MNMKTRTILCALLLGALFPVCQAQAPSPTKIEKEPAPAKLPAESNVPFEFGGGDLNDFISRIKDHWGVDMEVVASIPKTHGVRHNIKVPKMRMDQVHSRSWIALLDVYNQVSERLTNARMGTWIIVRQDVTSRTYSPTAAIVFAPPPDEPVNELIRAFDISGFTDADCEQLERLVSEGLQLSHERTSIVPPGSLRFNTSAKVLLAMGDDAYTGLVAEMVGLLKARKGILPVPLPQPQK
jgi:hypothetical protein